MIQPIDGAQRGEVVAATAHYVSLAARETGRDLPMVPVLFDLSGRSAGMFRAQGRDCVIRYNPWIFAKYYADNLAATVPHEVAHYVVHRTHAGRRRVAPHGPQWRAVMALFGADPAVTFDCDLTGIPQRRQREHPYRCRCRGHGLSTTRHNRVQRGAARYQCRHCGDELVFDATRLSNPGTSPRR